MGSESEQNAGRVSELPPFVRALLTGDAVAIRGLVAKGRDPSRPIEVDLDDLDEFEDFTPLMLAAGSDRGADAWTLRLLLELGADPGVLVEGDSAVFAACIGLGWDEEAGRRRGGDAARLGVLLEAGCPLPQDPDDANRLLCKTAATGDPERLGMLLERGLSPEPYFDPDKEEAGYRELSRRIREISEQTAREVGEESEPWIAEAKAEMDRMEEEDIARRRSAPSSYQIPLFRAAESGSAECVKLLLDAGADLEQRDSENRTALFHAASTEVARLLIEAGLPLDDRDRWDSTPLMSALGDLESPLRRVRALLEAGADPNATSDHGFTVFMNALITEERSVELLRLLVEHGADPRAVSDYGFNAFHAVTDVSFVGDDEENVRPIMSYLKELGVDIEHRNKNGQTPLAHAVEEGFVPEVAVLCELGADPNAVCSRRRWNGESHEEVEEPLLFHAVDGPCACSVEKTELLLRSGADPTAKNREGHTPLSIAVSDVASDAGEEGFREAFRSFFEAIRALQPPKELPKQREGFIATVTPGIRQAVERWVEKIPADEESNETVDDLDDDLEGYDERAEQLSIIVLLVAYEVWRHHTESGPAAPGQ
ncbi:MAG: ankyrin repeat domain-containing protein [Phycisphaerales bacterium]|nr:ankyrin repeat domain-containing protein [Phycisphaerales bacterium]